MIRRPPRSTLFPYTRSSDLSGPRLLPSAARTDDPVVRALSRRAMGKAPALGDHQPGPPQRLSRVSHGVADHGLARAPAARLPLRDPRRDAALRIARISRHRAVSRLARAGPADRDAGGEALERFRHAAEAGL